MSTTDVICIEERRREDVRQSSFYGLDFLDVTPDQKKLEVFFLGRAPQKISAANVTISGGRVVQVTSILMRRQSDPTLADSMDVNVDQPGDFSRYALALVALDENGRPTDRPMAGFDPLFNKLNFSFKASCPSDLDCRVTQVCPPPSPVQPDINYLAKDFGSFKQLILDRLAQTMPSWSETHVPDIGVMLVELLAYVGDQLSYYQDAVATEAYLGTARQRISVRRHARLVDYAMHEGCNARAWLTIGTTSGPPIEHASDVFFCTSFPGAPTGTHVLQPEDFAKAPPGSYEVFEPLVADPQQPIVLQAAHTEIFFYTWGDCACCLPKGSTRATLRDSWKQSDSEGDPQRVLSLRPNDVLIFEEVVGPRTGNPADTDPTHRQAVRLTKVTPALDPLYNADKGGQPVVEIEWCSEDALTFPLCISAVMPAPDCTCRENISVARGNVILVDNGASVSETLGTVPTSSTSQTCPTACDPPDVVLTPARFCPALQQTPLTYSQALPACGCASALIVQDPRQALPSITLTGTLMTPGGTQTTSWSPVPDLLESGPNDLNFVVEIDNAWYAHPRFGNNDEGRMPDAGTELAANYRVGDGKTGNVGAETITYLVFRATTPGISDFAPRNPMPATGGTEPEPIAEVRQFAPYAFRDVLERAITAADYATLAADNARRLAERQRLFVKAASMTTTLPALPKPDDPRAGLEEEPGGTNLLPPDICLIPFQPLQNARGTLRWTGSWYEALVAVDPLGTDSVDAETLTEIDAYLEPYRRIGQDLNVTAATYVPLDLGLSICVMPNALRGDAERTLLGILGGGVLPDGTLGMFNPNSLTFGQGVYMSPIVAAAQAVTGVTEVQITRLARYIVGTPAPGARPDDVPASGVLTMGPFEIARLDNDSSAPTNGRLTLVMRGGR